MATNELVLGTSYGAEIKDTVKADTKWNETYHTRRETITNYGTLNLATTNTTNDSLGFVVSRSESTGLEIVDTFDTLSFVNQSTDVAVKNFNFDSADDVYTSSVDVGETYGKVNVI